jgi:hypothetical protein
MKRQVGSRRPCAHAWSVEYLLHYLGRHRHYHPHSATITRPVAIAGPRTCGNQIRSAQARFPTQAAKAVDHPAPHLARWTTATPSRWERSRELRPPTHASPTSTLRVVDLRRMRGQTPAPPNHAASSFLHQCLAQVAPSSHSLGTERRQSSQYHIAAPYPWNGILRRQTLPAALATMVLPNVSKQNTTAKRTMQLQRPPDASRTVQLLVKLIK